MVKEIISRLTMVKTGRHFYDFINGQTIYHWQDCYFENYIAASRFGKRVKLNQ